jgi:hypothetical protein
MSYTTTAVLGLKKPVKGSGQQYDQDDANDNAQAIDDWAADVVAFMAAVPAANLSGTIDIARVPTIPLATKVSGTLPLANGGTGGTTFQTAREALGFYIQSGSPGGSAPTGALHIW